tara:strand:+ start:38 stop:1243 length:1206 start_codon:yes stop_codon:yes gene_type:complete
MTRFKGKNSIKKVRSLSRERAKYNLDAFGGINEAVPKQVVNFNFAEKTFYGRVDRQHNPVAPGLDFIVPLMSSNNKDSTINLMNFVADQYNDLEEHFVRACRLGLVPVDDPILSTLIAKRGFEDPLALYRSYMAGVLEAFVTNYLPPHRHQIKNFNDFLTRLPGFMARTRDNFPLTYSGFQTSNQSSIFTSGLVVDIGGIPFDNDEEKQNLMLDSPAFDFYLNLAKQYGFSVNERNPGVLISDLASPVTADYRAAYGMTNVDLVFVRQFNKTLYKDIELLSELLVNAYNVFVSYYPITRKFRICNNRTISDIYNKEYISIDNININDIINIYIQARNIEERNPYDEFQLKEVRENAYRIEKISRAMMIEYIDDQFKRKYNQKDGSLTYYQKKFQLKLDSKK